MFWRVLPGYVVKETGVVGTKRVYRANGFAVFLSCGTNQDTRYKIQELYSQPHAGQRKEIGCSRQEHGITDIQ